jgi:hypothetical protein
MPRFLADVRAAIRDRVPYRIGHYEVTGELGAGGFGVVLAASDPGLGRTVAIKLCPTASPKAADALMNEARALAKLSHPNIVTIHELGRSSENSEYVFFVMEHVDGPTGHDFIRQRPTREQILDIYCALGRGLAAAHAAGFVHGDVKPSNFLIGRDGIVRVADFGLAKAHEHLSASAREERRRRTGTLPYMPPESLRGQVGDARADQFSFCVALLQTFTRELPFDGKDTATVLAQIDRLEPKLWHWRVPANVRPILRRGLSVDPRDRYPSMDALLDDLERAGGVTTLRPGAVVGAPASKAMRGAFAASLIVVSVALGWAGRGRVAVEPARVSEPTPAPAPAPSPCAMVASDPTASSKSALIPTCSRIRAGELLPATRLWDVEFNDRRRAGPGEPAPTEKELAQLRAETLIVARTFVDQAERMSRWAWVSQTIQGTATVLGWRIPDDPIVTATDGAHLWLIRIKQYLATEGLGPEDPDLQDVRERVDRLRSAGYSQHSTNPFSSTNP